VAILGAAGRRGRNGSPRAASGSSRGAGVCWLPVEGVEPIVIAVDLPVPPAEAYAAFAGGFADWWPAATHSLSRLLGARCQLDAVPGGRLEERAPDGARHLWGTVQAVEPGRRLRFSWHPGREPDSAQWVDVAFAPAASGSRVTLTHGGWEALGEIAPILRREYVCAWQNVLGATYAGFVRARSAATA
jgi:uncharacterized protein YndB with AHSA1/START domain